MAKIRVFELAKKMGVPSNQLLEELQALGIDVKSNLSTLDETDLEKLGGKVAKPAAKKAAKPTEPPAAAEAGKEKRTPAPPEKSAPAAAQAPHAPRGPKPPASGTGKASGGGGQPQGRPVAGRAAQPSAPVRQGQPQQAPPAARRPEHPSHHPSPAHGPERRQPQQAGRPG
ncbi:MAG: translation initiation factor IF-2 N-terminal domain-containing protein, partial [Acidobacteriota bacterium]